MFYSWNPFSEFFAGQCTLTNPPDPFQRLAWKIYFNPTLPGRCLSTNFISSAGIQPSSSLLNTRKVSWNTYMLSHDKGKCKKKIVSPTVKYTACQTGWTVKTFLIFASLCPPCPLTESFCWKKKPWNVSRCPSPSSFPWWRSRSPGKETQTLET